MGAMRLISWKRKSSVHVSLLKIVSILRTSWATEPSSLNRWVTNPWPRLVHQLTPIPTANGCESQRYSGYEICWECVKWVEVWSFETQTFEICRFRVRKTTLAAVIDLSNCPTVVHRSNRCSIEHFHSICCSFSVWPFEKPFLINAKSSIHPPPMRANDKYYHKQTLKRVHHHRSTVELSTSIFRRIDWRMADALARLCSVENRTSVLCCDGGGETLNLSKTNLLKISTRKASVLDLTEINEAPVMSRVSSLYRNALIVEPYVLRFQQCIFRCWSYA